MCIYIIYNIILYYIRYVYIYIYIMYVQDLHRLGLVCASKV